MFASDSIKRSVRSPTDFCMFCLQCIVVLKKHNCYVITLLLHVQHDITRYLLNVLVFPLGWVFISNHFIYVLCMLASVGRGFRRSTYCEVRRHHQHVAMATPWWHLIATSMYLEGQLTAPCQMICTAMTLTHKPGPL